MKIVEKANNIPITSKVTRPWQGNLTVILFTLALIASCIKVFTIIYAWIKVPDVFTPIYIGISIFLIAVFIFQILIIYGFLKGKKWAVILLLGFSLLGILACLYSPSGGPFILFLLNAYISYSCLKHPFYATKK